MAETSTTLVSLTGNPAIDGLLDRSSWLADGDGVVLTWSAHNAGGAWTSAELILVRAAFDAWSAVANVDFVELESNDSYRFTTADIAMVATGDRLIRLEDAVGLAFLPIFDPSPTPLFGFVFTFEEYPHPEGDIFIDDPGTGSYSLGTDDFATLIHEIGHALGLKHPHDTPRSYSRLGIDDQDVAQWTVMSYEQTPGTTLLEGWPATPMPNDILAIQHIYGANMAYRTGDDTYLLEVDGIYRTLWDAGGTDTLDASALTFGISLSLKEGTFTYHGARSATAIAYDVTIENAIGTSGNDDMSGNSAANLLSGLDGADVLRGFGGDDTLFGGGGKDELIGGGGSDLLYGDAGNDRFRFRAADALVDGGEGNDRLVINGKDKLVDLTGIPDGTITGIEIIDLRGTGDNTLIVDAAEVLDLSLTSDVLRVSGNAGDVVEMGDGWSAGDDVTIGSQLYHQFTQGDAELLIDVDILILS
ncbi:MAG: M10 family metallopeptidase C-terminal domain-containing protein [Gammaproteobacteria bacterium]|nr:M10 family metallopeptidase C-terminal domain-containing protein [Gammaproteobacteria bacterium]